jgi:hypothetical protein
MFCEKGNPLLHEGLLEVILDRPMKVLNKRLIHKVICSLTHPFRFSGIGKSVLHIFCVMHGWNFK